MTIPFFIRRALLQTPPRAIISATVTYGEAVTTQALALRRADSTVIILTPCRPSGARTCWEIPSARDRLESGGCRRALHSPPVRVERQGPWDWVLILSPREQAVVGKSDYSLRGDHTAVLLFQLHCEPFLRREEQTACGRRLIIPIITSRGKKSVYLPETPAFAKRRYTRGRTNAHKGADIKCPSDILRGVLPTHCSLNATGLNVSSHR